MLGTLVGIAFFASDSLFIYVGNGEAAEYIFPKLLSSINGAARGGRLQHGELRNRNAAANGPIKRISLQTALA